MGRQHQELDRPGVRQVPEGSGEQGNIKETGDEIIIMWCPNDPRGYGGDDDDDEASTVRKQYTLPHGKTEPFLAFIFIERGRDM